MAPTFNSALQLFLLTLCVSIALTACATPQGRIVGGATVDIASAPHLVSIRYKHNASTPFSHRCSGTIYAEDIVLTTARCVIGLERNQLLIVAGSSYRTQSDGYVYLIKTILIHPDFDIWFIDSDLALLRLEYPLTRQHAKVIRPIEVAEELPTAGSAATVAGWGASAEYGAFEEQLQEATVRVLDSAQCKQAYGAGRISAAMLCAGGESANGVAIDACLGDAGSALVSNGTVVGLVSWGNGCGRVGFPGVYTNLVHFQQWISSEASNNN